MASTTVGRVAPDGLRRAGVRRARRRAGVLACAVVGAALSVAGMPIGAAAAGASVASAAAKAHGQIPTVTNATNLTEEPVIHADKVKPPSKVLTKDLVAGTGTAVSASSSVTVKYVGANYKTGKDFTVQTWKTGEAATFSLSKVVPGFAAGLVGMKVGGRREIVIPPKYGYKDTAVGPIKADETLVFVVDLESVSSGS